MEEGILDICQWSLFMSTGSPKQRCYNKKMMVIFFWHSYRNLLLYMFPYWWSIIKFEGVDFFICQNGSVETHYEINCVLVPVATVILKITLHLFFSSTRDFLYCTNTLLFSWFNVVTLNDITKPFKREHKKLIICKHILGSQVVCVQWVFKITKHTLLSS